MAKVRMSFPRLGCKKTITFILNVLACWLACSEGSPMPGYDTAYGEAHRKRDLGSSLANELSLSVQQLPRNWGLSEYVNKLGSRLSPSQASDKPESAANGLQPFERLWARGTQLNHIWFPDIQELGDNTCLLFYSTTFQGNLLYSVR